jgi:putative tryptophan/tyrosine transport system substrate-binding protein
MRRRDFIMVGGAAVTWPFAARAQQKPRVPTVGILWHGGNAEEEAIFLSQIQEGLQALDYVEGRNITLLNTFADEQYERFSSNATELVRRKVDVLVAVTLPAALAAQRATKTIPIVFILVSDPVASKLVASLAHPGGNITGLSNLSEDLLGKSLELFRQVVPHLSGIELMINPSSDPVATELSAKRVENAAQRLHLSFRLVEAQRSDQIAQAFSSNADVTNGLMVDADGLFFRERKRIAELALKHNIPTSVFDPAMVEVGGLMTYAPNVKVIFRRSATYIDKILKGAKPDELPVELPSKFDFVINLKTAEKLGIEIPNSTQLLADEMIE